MLPVDKVHEWLASLAGKPSAQKPDISRLQQGRAQPSAADIELFRKIDKDVRSHPDFYREAGRWLDREYSAGAFQRKRQGKRRREVQGLLRKEQRALHIVGLTRPQLRVLREKEQRGKAGKETCLSESERQQLRAFGELRDSLTLGRIKSLDEMRSQARGSRGRMWRSVRILPRDRFTQAVKSCLTSARLVPSRTQSKRVILLTWLATEGLSTRAKPRPGVTDLERWAWGDPEKRSARQRCQTLTVWVRNGQYAAWIDLARKAWAVLGGDSPAARKQRKSAKKRPKTETQQAVYQELVPEQVMKRFHELPVKNETQKKIWIEVWRMRNRPSKEIAEHLKTELGVEISPGRVRQIRPKAKKWVLQNPQQLSSKTNQKADRILARLKKVYRDLPEYVWSNEGKDVRQEILTELLTSQDPKKAERAARKVLDHLRREASRRNGNIDEAEVSSS